MTLEEHAASIEQALRQLVRVDRRQWTTPEDKEDLVRILKSQVIAADRVLQLQATPETTSARGKFMAMTELARGSVKSYEEKGTLI
jgi:hypothetical protein